MMPNVILTDFFDCQLTPLHHSSLTAHGGILFSIVNRIKNIGGNMSPDAALVVFTSLGFASIFLALVIGITGHEPADLVTGIANMTPSARRQAQFEQLDYMTRVADEAIEARRLGKRAPFTQDSF
jgi:hypothetical protein